MTRIMIDAASPQGITKYVGHVDLVAGYKTGTPGQSWNGHPADVWIDQHGFGEHDYSANVMDVEPQCWGVDSVLNWTGNCLAPRPTVYCDKNDYPSVRALWKGDIWLAAPGGVNIADYPGVIAVQDTFTADYDLTTVYDPDWPNKAVVTPPPPPDFHFSATELFRQYDLQWDVVPNTGHYVVQHMSASSNLVWRIPQPTGTVVNFQAPIPVASGALMVHAIVDARAILIMSEVI